MISVLFGTLFKLMHWPGANEMVIAGLGSVIFIIPFYFIVRIKDTPSFFGKFAYFSLILSTAVSVLGVLFKIMYWPGANEMLILGIGSLIFPSLLFYSIFQIKKSTTNFKESYYGFFGILLFCLLVVSFAYRPVSDVVNSFYYMNQLLENKNGTHQLNSEQLNLVYQDEQIQSNLIGLYQTIEEVKEKILLDCHVRKNDDGSIDYKKDNLDASIRILVNNSKGNELYQKLVDINDKIRRNSGNENFTFLILIGESKSYDWSRKNFSNMPASGTIAKLTAIQSELKSVMKDSR